MMRRAPVLLLFAVTACERSVTLRSPDGTLELTVPGKWTTDDLNKLAVIQASSRPDEQYAMVITEPKAPLKGMSLERFSEITRAAQLKSMTGGAERGGTDRTVNGLPGREYELTGTVGKGVVTMKHVSIEGADRFHQVIVWTLSSRWDAGQATLDKVVESFKERTAAR